MSVRSPFIGSLLPGSNSCVSCYFLHTGIPRLFLPLVMYILDSLWGAIKAFETQPTCSSFPWLQLLNQIVKYLDGNYKLIFERLWPRRRGTGGGPEVIVGLSEEELDTGAAGPKKTPKNKISGDKDQLPERKKFPTKVKVKYTLIDLVVRHRRGDFLYTFLFPPRF